MSTTTSLICRISRETEKAIQAKVVYHNLKEGAPREWECWFPKSQVKVQETSNDKFKEVIAPEWLANKIEREICQFLRTPFMSGEFSLFNITA